MFLNDFIKGALSNEANCFIIDSSSDGKHKDIDFKKYNWNTRQNNKIREGDYFVYRRSNKYSSDNQFYFFGAGRFGKIINIDLDSKKVTANIEEPYYFTTRIRKDDMENIHWNFRRNSNSWRNSFTAYGITQIDKGDFCKIINLQSKLTNFKDQLMINEEPLAIMVHKKIQSCDYFIDDEFGDLKTRGVAQKYFSDIIKYNYGYKCAITGISTRKFLVGSHIIPWSDSKKDRLDPSNGICLSSLFDKAFDEGFITFENSGRMRISEEVYYDEYLLHQINEFKDVKIPMNKKFSPNKIFLEYHRNKIFKG